MWYLCVFLVFSNSSIAAPDYLSFQADVSNDRDSIIKSYFLLGFQYCEILAFLSSLHGIQLSLRQLKRVLRRMGLQRRGGYATAGELQDAVLQELQGSGSCLGYRQMQQKLRQEHGLVATRERIRI